MPLPANWVDNIGMQVDAAYLNQVDTTVNANTETRPQTGTYAARPAASSSNNGALYFCTDTDAVYKSNGSTWTKIRIGGNAGSMADPPSSGLTTTSLGSAAFSSDLDGRLLSAPTNAGDAWRVEYKALPVSSNYTATAYIDPVTAPAANFWFSGIVLVNSSTGALITFGPMFDTAIAPGFSICAIKWTNATTISASYASALSGNASPRYLPNWFRVKDDGTNRLFQYSFNNIDWTTVHTVGRTNFTTPDSIGWGANNNGIGSTVSFRCRSFTVT